jgi:RimJ/RimL family protein N-acetyltransferase
VRFVTTRDLDEFASRAQGFLAEGIERNVLATILSDQLYGHYGDSSRVYGYGLDEGGELRFAALRTAPWPLLVTELAPELAPSFMARWLEADPEPSGVSSLPQTARAMCDAWSARTGGRTRCRFSEAMHVLERVLEPPRPAEGRLRPAHEDERELMVRWMQGFADDAGIDSAQVQAEAMVAQRLERGRLLVWDHEGPVSMAGVNGPVAGVVRVGPVYTPPDRRCHGYATSLVAAASRRALAEGATSCMLYTDLANPTSNKIYADIGYRRVGDWEEYVFEGG